MNTIHKIDCDKFHKSNTNKELIVTQHFWSTKYAPDTIKHWYEYKESDMSQV